MKRWVVHTSAFLGFASLLLAPRVRAQSLEQDLRELVETPAIPGYEQELIGRIRAKLERYKPQGDSLGNVWITVGSGAPHRLIVVPVDEPGYVVSGITDDGYLRAQRLPQQAPHGFFDGLYAAQPVRIAARSGKWVSGVVAGLSTHLQPGRLNPPQVNHPDEMYIDIGAATPAQVRGAGVDLLDPITLDRKLYVMGYGKMTAPVIGDRFGPAALLELARRLDPANLRGTLTLAFVTQQWTGARGLARLLEEMKPDEMIYVGRLLPQVVALPADSGTRLRLQIPTREPGSGVLVGGLEPRTVTSAFAAELSQLAAKNKIPLATDFSAPLFPKSYLPNPELPERFAHLAIPTAWPATPAETIDFQDLLHLAGLLGDYVQGSAPQGAGLGEARSEGVGAAPPKPRTAPSVEELLRVLVETYGVSGHEASVREEISRLLPTWAKPETDAADNLVLRLSSAPGGAKAPRILFVAHMDEIGFEVKSIADDGRLEVEWRGGGIAEFFAGHAALVHSENGVHPGVMELPPGWEQPGFEWPRRPLAFYRADVGARSPAEVAQLGIKAGDWVTVPKKYRPLAGARASGRGFDDRVGCTALLAAVWLLGPKLEGRDVAFLWSTGEEVGLVGAFAAAQRMAGENRVPDYVFAVDTFVSSDSPLESKRFADARLGQGFVVRAVDNSNLVPRKLVARIVELARANKIPVQYGVTGGGNDGAAFLRFGAIDVALGWPLRYSHSPGEVADTRDVEALARIIAALARSW